MRVKYIFHTLRASKRILALFMLALAFPLTAVSGAFAQSVASQPGSDEIVTLLETNDIHGRIYLPDAPQGLTKIASMVRRIREDTPNTLLLDAGDIIHGTPAAVLNHGLPVLDAMDALGYDAAAAGNHEFDFGQDITQNAIKYAHFPFLSANVLNSETGQPWGGLTPYIIKNVGGVRIAIFGLTTPETVELEWPSTLKGIRFADPIETAKALVPKLRNDEHADVVIALTHLGANADVRLAKSVSGIDFILGGHSHTRIDKQLWVNGVLIAQTGSYAKALGRIDFLCHRDPVTGKESIASVNGKDGGWWGRGKTSSPAPDAAFPNTPLIPVPAGTVDDPLVLAAYKPWADKTDSEMKIVLTTASEEIKTRNVNERENEVADLAADAVRAEAGADISIVDSSQVGPSGIAKGDVTVGEIHKLFGAYTRQHIVIADIPGARLLELLAKPPHFEGNRYILSGVQKTDDGMLEAGGFGVDKDRRYRIAGSAYVIEGLFYGKSGVSIEYDDVHGPTIRDDVIEYLRGHLPLLANTDSGANRWQLERVKKTALK
jgi:2',3'-cyclic-nucleotide 2'-phosphodiesterase (5'-nucleotidase family)